MLSLRFVLNVPMLISLVVPLVSLNLKDTSLNRAEKLVFFPVW